MLLAYTIIDSIPKKTKTSSNKLSLSFKKHLKTMTNHNHPPSLSIKNMDNSFVYQTCHIDLFQNLSLLGLSND